MAKVDQNDLQYFKEACDKTYATSKGADSNGIVQQQVDKKNVYPKTKPEAITMADGNNLKQAMDTKQDKNLVFTDKTASNWVSDSTFSDFSYRCDISCPGVTDTMFAEVAFAMEQAMSGDYSPICETRTDVVSIWSKRNESVTIPSIIIHK